MNQEEPKEVYGLFNGRRSADQYVKGILKVYTAISGTALALAVSFGVWATLNINELKTRVTVIESSRFTAQDANILINNLQKELTAIRLEISKLPKEAPPTWVRDIIIQNSKDIRDLEKKVK